MTTLFRWSAPEHWGPGHPGVGLRGTEQVRGGRAAPATAAHPQCALTPQAALKDGAVSSALQEGRPEARVLGPSPTLCPLFTPGWGLCHQHRGTLTCAVADAAVAVHCSLSLALSFQSYIERQSLVKVSAHPFVDTTSQTPCMNHPVGPVTGLLPRSGAPSPLGASFTK